VIGGFSQAFPRTLKIIRFHKKARIPKFPDLWAVHPSAFPSDRLNQAVKQ